MGLGHSPSFPRSNTWNANHAGCGPVVSLQNPSRSPVGEPCAPAPAGRPALFGEETEVDTPRPACPGLAMRSVGWLALRTHHRQAGDCDRLAPERLPPFLDLEGPGWPARASVGSERRTCSDPSDEPSEPNLGRPRIHGELLKLGMNIGETSVSKYMDRHRKPP